MPYAPLDDGDEDTAAHRLANIYDQVIAQVTSATRPPGTAGQVIFETDTGRYYGHDGSGYVQLGGLTAAALNTHTPQIDQGASTNIAKTTVYSQFQRLGNLCYWSFAFTMTAAGTAGSNVTLTTPVTLASTGSPAGGGSIYDASTTTHYNGTWIPALTTSIRLFVDQNANAAWGASPNLALASGDVIRGSVWLPVA
jgi:hypothetical protein